MATWSEFAKSAPGIAELAFALDIERALYSHYKSRGEPDSFPPTYMKWRDG